MPFSVGFAVDEAEVFRQARLGEPAHMADLALLHHADGHHDVEREWLEKAAVGGSLVAMARFGRVLISDGDEERGRALVAAALTGGEAASVQDFLDVGIDLACFGDSEGVSRCSEDFTNAQICFIRLGALHLLTSACTTEVPSVTHHFGRFQP